jgi:hypothetical protein
MKLAKMGLLRGMPRKDRGKKLRRGRGFRAQCTIITEATTVY